MTNPTVTQVDRDRAAALSSACFPNSIRATEWLRQGNVADDAGNVADDGEWIQAFARHREEAEKGLNDIRETLRQKMLGLSITGTRETFVDGFHDGLAFSILRIDEALGPKA